MGISAFFKRFKGKQAEQVAPVVEAAEPKVQMTSPVAPEIRKTPAPVAKPATPAPIAKPAPAISPAPRPIVRSAPLSPYALTGGAKNQSDWLLLQIGKTGRAFVAAADKAKLTVAKPVSKDGSFVRHDMTAALLGYRLVLTAYHLHQEVPSLEALRIVRNQMTGMLHRAVDITVEQTGNKDQRSAMLSAAEDQFKSAEKEIMEACYQLRGKSKEPFMGFYASLVPAFGFEESSHEHHQRFGGLLADLYARIENSMLARNHQITG